MHYSFPILKKHGSLCFPPFPDSPRDFLLFLWTASLRLFPCLLFNSTPPYRGELLFPPYMRFFEDFHAPSIYSASTAAYSPPPSSNHLPSNAREALGRVCVISREGVFPRRGVRLPAGFPFFFSGISDFVFFFLLLRQLSFPLSHPMLLVRFFSYFSKARYPLTHRPPILQNIKALLQTMTH